jgi:hypothetical protein
MVDLRESDKPCALKAFMTRFSVFGLRLLLSKSLFKSRYGRL